MSYILDALRKADADRVRGAVPDLNAQPLAATGVGISLTERSPVPWGWLGAGMALALVAVGGWQVLGDDTAAPAAQAPATATMPIAVSPPAAAVQPGGPAATAATPLPAGPPATAAPAVAAPPAAAAPITEPDKAARTSAAPRPARANAAASAPPRKDAAAARKSAPVAAAPSADGVPAAAGSAPASAVDAARSATGGPSEKVPKLAELPESVRRQVPALAIGGAVYSPQPSARMVIVNGEVVREGDAVAPGLKLERIDPKSAVFSFRGQRFEVPM